MMSARRNTNTPNEVIKYLSYILLLILLSMSFFGCGKKEEVPELIDSVADIEAIRPVTKRIVGRVEILEGSVIPKEYPCFSSTAVTISEVMVGVGDHVKEGDVVARADTASLTEEYEDVRRQIEELSRHKTLAKEVTDLTLEKLMIERETEQILHDQYELEKKDKEIAIQKEEYRFDMSITDSDLKLLTERRDKIKKELDSRTYTAPHDGYVTFVKDFSKSNFVESCENIVVISDYDDLYIEATGLSSDKYAYSEYQSKWTYLNGKRVEITEHSYTPEEISYAQGVGKYPYQTFDPVGGKLSIGSNLILFFLAGDSQEKLAVGNDSINRENGEDFVYVRNAAGKTEKRIVELGAEDSLYTEVKSGLSEGEFVYYTNQYLPPSKYETIEAGLADYIEDDQTKSARIAYPYCNFLLAAAGGIFHGSKEARSVSEGEVVGTITTSEGVLASEDARYALSSLDRNREREKYSYEAGKNSLLAAGKEIEGVDAPDPTNEIDAEMPMTNDDQIRSLRHLDKRLGIDLDILNRTEQAAKQSYESNRKALSERYRKLQKNAEGDGINIQSPVDGKIEFVSLKDGDEVYKGSFLMSVMSGGKAGGSTILYVSMPEGGTGVKVRYMPLIGQKVVAKKGEKEWSGSCVGINGDAQRFMLFTRNGKQYATFSAPFAKNSVPYQFYLKMDEELTDNDMKEMEITFEGKHFEDVIVIPSLAVREEYNMYSDTTKYYVWKLENDQIVKEYVKVYRTGAASGVCYIMDGVKEKDKILK